jgi:hypothetical protein
MAVAVMLTLAGTAQAALQDRGGGMIYDDVLDITWLQDWNYAKTSGYHADGQMGWIAAKTWAENLVYGGYNDWRLPTVSPVNGSSFQFAFSNNGSTDIGYARTGAGGGWGPSSEIGHLYYVTLANKGYCTPNDAAPAGCDEQPGWGWVNSNPFKNVQSVGYWSGSAEPHAPNPVSAWLVSPIDGSQTITVFEAYSLYAVAVRPGDVAAIPEPQSVALVLFGLGALAVVLRRRQGQGA